MRIPSRIQVGKSEYAVAYLKELDERLAGICCSTQKIIIVSGNEPKAMLEPTFFHEWLHAVEDEYSVKLGHEKIGKLEYAMAELFAQLVPRKRG